MTRDEYSDLIDRVTDHNLQDGDWKFLQETLIMLAQVWGKGPFICGYGGNLYDGSGLHESYHICPQFGADVVEIYKRVKIPD